jgi:uncharacterized cupredoxin-like copper-binding protein
MRPSVCVFLVPFLLIAAAAAAQAPATMVEVDVWNFKFDPDAITLRAGTPYVLHLVNKSGSRHDFTAKAFFAASTVAPEDRGAVIDGKVDLAPNQSRDLHLVAPAAGSYETRCSHVLHAHLGTKGNILVR